MNELPLNDDTLDDYKRATLDEARKRRLADMSARLGAAMVASPPQEPEGDRVAREGLSDLAAPKDPERELWDTLDVVRQTARGFAQAGLEIGSTVTDVGQAVGFPGADAAAAILEDQKSLVKQTYGEATSVAGEVARPLAQFGAGAAALAPVAGATGVTGALKAAPGLVRAAAGGTAVGAAAFDPHEERVSNMLKGTWAENPVSEWLAANEDDSALEGRLKSAIENAGVGLALHGAGSLVKTVARHVRNRRVAFNPANTPTPPSKSLIEAAEEVEVARAAVKDIRAQIGRNPEAGNLEKLKTAKQEFKDLRDRALAHWTSMKNTDEYRRLDPRVRERLDAMVDGREAQLTRTPTAAMTDELGRRAAGRIAGDLEKGLDLAAAKALVRSGVSHTDAAAEALRNNFNVGIMDFEDTGQIAVLGEAIRAGAAAVEKLSPAPGKPGEFMERTGDLARRLIGEVDPAELLRRGSLLARDMKDAGALMLGLEVTAKSIAKQTAEIARRVAQAGERASAEDEAMLIQAVRNVQAFLAPLKGIQREGARATASRRLRKGFESGTIPLDVLDRAISEDFMSRENLHRIARKLQLSADDPAALLEAAAKPHAHPIANAVKEYYVNSILSGPTTQSVNILGNTMKMLWDPAEQGVETFWREYGKGASMASAFGDAAGEMRAAYGAFLETSFAFVKTLGRALRMGPSAFAQNLPTGITGAFDPRSMAANVIDAARSGKGQLTAGSFAGEHFGNAITTQALIGDTSSTMLRMAVDFAGNVIRLPSRLMATTDEVFTNLNFFMHARREAYRLGRQQGLRGDRLQEFMRTFVNNADTETLDAVMERSIASAKRNVWQEELGDFSKRVQGGLQAHPTLGLLVPFFKTPVNIIKYGAKRHPAYVVFEGLFGKNAVARKFLMGTPEGRRALLATPEGAEYAGRFTTAAMLTGAMALTINEDWITGRPPSNPDHRAAWEATGRQPYSIRVGDKWISYGRLDPFGMLLGMHADLFLPNPGPRGVDDDVVAATWASVAEMIRSRNYLKGLVSFVEAFSDPSGRFAKTFLLQQSGGFVPNAISQLDGKIDFWGLFNADPVMRDPKEYGRDGRLDLMRSLVNNLGMRAGSDDAPRSFSVFGPRTRAVGVGWDVASPLLAQQARDSKFAEVLSASGANPTLDERIKEVKGYAVPYKHRDRFGELYTTVKIQGLTLAEAGEKVANDPRFAALPDAPVDDDDHSRTKRTVLNNLFTKYRDAAFNALASEIPEVGEEYRQFKAAQKDQLALRALLEYGK